MFCQDEGAQATYDPEDAIVLEDAFGTGLGEVKGEDEMKSTECVPGPTQLAQLPESIMPQAPHSNDPSNRKSHKKGKKRHRNEEDEVVEKKSKKAKHAQNTAEEIPGATLTLLLDPRVSLTNHGVKVLGR